MHKVRQDRPLDPGTLAVLTRLQFIATSRQLSNQAVERILADTSQRDRLLVHIGRNVDPVVAVRFLDQFASGLRMADIPQL